MYARIQNGGIAEILPSLPKSWGNISNFDALTRDKLSDLSWAGLDDRFYEITEMPMPDYDPSREKLTQRFQIDEQSQKAIKEWAVENKTEEEIQADIETENNEILRTWEEVRKTRNRLLSESDWTQLPDSPISSIQVQEWRTYRQALRDITQQSDPRSLVWPAIPS
jgi:hypothetical protein